MVAAPFYDIEEVAKTSVAFNRDFAERPIGGSLLETSKYGSIRPFKRFFRCREAVAIHSTSLKVFVGARRSPRREVLLSKLEQRVGVRTCARQGRLVRHGARSGNGTETARRRSDRSSIGNWATNRLQAAQQFNHDLESSIVDRTFAACKLDVPMETRLALSGDK